MSSWHSRSKVSLALLGAFVIALAVTVQWLITTSFAERVQFDLGLAQLIVVPVLAIGLFFVGKPVLPRWVVVICAACAVMVTLPAFTPISQGTNELLVSRFADDNFGARSRIFRKDLRSRFDPRSNVTITPYHFHISNAAEARSVVDQQPAGSALIWFNGPATVIEFARTPFRTLKGPAFVHLPHELQRLRMFQSVSRVNVASEELADTQLFLNHLISAIVPALGPEGTLASAYAETDLFRAATIRAGWRSRAHQAYAVWLLGNLYLREAVEGARYQPAAMACAYQAYLKAGTMLTTRDNRELVVAIVNNQSVALALQAAFGREPQRTRQARNGLRLSKKYAKGLEKAKQTEFFSLINGNIKQLNLRPRKRALKAKKRVRVGAHRSKPVQETSSKSKGQEAKKRGK